MRLRLPSPYESNRKVENVLRCDADGDDVLLQGMKITRLDKEDSCESVLRESACIGIIVRTEHAE